MNGKSILVQCNRPDLKTSYAYFSMHDRALQIIYLNVQSGGVMIPIHSEDLLFSEYPEARLLHDGNAWNVGELSCWLKFAETETEERDS